MKELTLIMAINLTFEEQTQELISELLEENFSLVLEKSNQLVANFPNIEILHLLRGAAQINLHEHSDAIKSYLKVIEINENNFDAYNNLGIMYENTNNFSAAIKNFKSAVRIDPFRFEVHFNLGNIYRKLNDLQAAIASYTLATDIRPDFPEALCNKGSCLSELDNDLAALDCFQSAVKIDPGYVEAHNNKSVSLKKLGQLSAAKNSAHRAIKLSPSYASAHNNLGNINLALGHQELAMANYIAASKFNSTLPNVFSNLASVLLQLGDKSGALEKYTEALRVNPDDAQAEYFINVLSVANTPSPPTKYIENLFDEYAIHFEESLLEKLSYKTPQILAEILVHKDGNHSLGNVLDLGCGTGLVGTQLKQFCSKITGVDLSKAMLQEANKKDIYFKLEHCNIIDYLNNDKLGFNYFIAADVFTYVGDLTEVFHLIKKRNKCNGCLVFSTEHTDTGAYQLNISGRYSHSKKYIQDLCLEFDYEFKHFSKVNLRKEGEVFLTGGIYILEF